MNLPTAKSKVTRSRHPLLFWIVVVHQSWANFCKLPQENINLMTVFSISITFSLMSNCTVLGRNEWTFRKCNFDSEFVIVFKIWPFKFVVVFLMLIFQSIPGLTGFKFSNHSGILKRAFSKTFWDIYIWNIATSLGIDFLFNKTLK